MEPSSLVISQCFLLYQFVATRRQPEFISALSAIQHSLLAESGEPVVAGKQFQQTEAWIELEFECHQSGDEEEALLKPFVIAARS